MKKIFQFNLNLLIPIFILNAMSIIILKNITPYLSENVANVDFAYLQFRGIVLGLIMFIILQFFNLQKISKIYYLAYWVLWVMLLILAIEPPIIKDLFINQLNGANGWFYPLTKAAKISFQPVEFMKIILIFILSDISYKHMTSSDPDKKLVTKFLLYAGPILLFVLLQPDFGGFMLLLVPAFIIFVFSLKKVKTKMLIIFTATPLVLLVGVLFLTPVGNDLLLNTGLIDSYQIARFDFWLKPFEGAADGGRMLYASLINIGSTGITGHGVGQLPVATPEIQTDFIFTAVGSFFGIIGMLAVIGIFVYLLISILIIASRTPDIFYKFVLIGIGTLIFTQVFENIAMTVGITPITGIVLPFLSYGSTAMITFYILFGIVGNIQSTTLNVSSSQYYNSYD